MKFYISGALKGSRNLLAARELYERAGEAVKMLGHQPYIPHQTTDPIHAANLPSRSVFESDISAMLSANGVIAFLNEPSFGVGAEIAICGREGIPILALHNHRVDASRFILGCLDAYGGHVVAYHSPEEMENEILSFIHHLENQ